LARLGRVLFFFVQRGGLRQRSTSPFSTPPLSLLLFFTGEPGTGPFFPPCRDGNSRCGLLFRRPTTTTTEGPGQTPPLFSCVLFGEGFFLHGLLNLLACGPFLFSWDFAFPSRMAHISWDVSTHRVPPVFPLCLSTTSSFDLLPTPLGVTGRESSLERI